MQGSQAQRSRRGRPVTVQSLEVDERRIDISGRFLKRALVYDEFYALNGIVTAPESTIAALKQWDERPDIFEFSQKCTDPHPRYAYHHEADNMAVLRITDYDTWIRTQAKRDVRENVRRAAREGVRTEVCRFDDAFVAHVKALYDGMPLRQGRPFWHYGKDHATIKRDAGHYLDRSDFIGAFLGDTLIGFLKMVYVGDIAKTMYVNTDERHFIKRPGNALIAKAVEVCASKGIRYFNYGRFDYPGRRTNSLIDFKVRHGFERFEFPRYYVPLTPAGRVYLGLSLHKGLKRLIPDPVMVRLLRARGDWHRYALQGRQLLADAQRGTRGGA